ncbi:MULTISPECIES: transglutaminaseTgpA domain-containing protein [unclassified Paenibacillus]|uniref:transglutaminase TgpA family protein n=1 Tax=unclassified Paenibacillus TaxID=185978 RepID=UPI001AE0FAB8|nr:MULTISPECIES: transglutaminaseTgpA domain-containing protein [unclassified Paenibacillus]MBP1156391.1 transglutaminase-like putative cysteine protease [Paenibacillus sp. PvP091]MBP1168223.1 transglutaminase-like putative cysteine protease [Paenibacillus sp. PvR098]MBP2439251.1 transglutaminase-like putative cysteine protease [Paenibacillus sp. PvP052]
MNEKPLSWWKHLLFHNWPHRLTVLLCGVFLLQFTIWFSKEEGMWLRETVVIVQLTLLTIFIMEHVPRIHWLLRGAIELAAILIIHIQALQQFEVIEPMKFSSFFSSHLFLNLYELTPYLWFGLGAWVAYLTMIWWVEAKWRLYVLLVMTVLAMCIRDSFSAVYLWPQVAIIVGCGLLLLILCHFTQLRRKDASAWRHLAHYPASIAIPVVSLVSLTIFIGALMPEVGPTLTDPYTAWRNFKGEPMNFTTGKGIQVSTAVDAADSSSGYSRNDSNLGGGFQFDYTPVMAVETTHRAYWRGESRSLYTGRGWEESDSERRAAWSAVRPDNPVPVDPRHPAGNRKTVEVTQTVTLLTEQRYPVLFGAYAVQKVTGINGAKSGFDPLQWSSQQSELRFSERQSYPKTYTVVSQMPIVDEAALRALPMEPARPGMNEYLQLPDNLPERVRTLASDITREATNPYDKAKRIEQYLQLNFPYTNRPDLSKGRSRDFVDRFLFEIQEGYCDYYSSAMVVMARSVGLPTRWVKGYASGATDWNGELLGMFPEDTMTNADASGVYKVRNSDAHSWVEVYFNGYGWIPFEPTSGFALPMVTAEADPAIDTSEAPAPIETETEENASVVEPHHVATGGIIAAVALFAAFLVWKLQLIELLRERERRRRASLLKQKVIVECERLLRIFRRNGYVREEHETLREATRRWSKQSRWMKSELDTVLHVFEKAKYGNAEITEEDWRQTTQIVEKLRSQM